MSARAGTWVLGLLMLFTLTAVYLVSYAEIGRAHV